MTTNSYGAVTFRESLVKPCYMSCFYLYPFVFFPVLLSMHIYVVLIVLFSFYFSVLAVHVFFSQQWYSCQFDHTVFIYVERKKDVKVANKDFKLTDANFKSLNQNFNRLIVSMQVIMIKKRL